MAGMCFATLWSPLVHRKLTNKNVTIQNMMDIFPVTGSIKLKCPTDQAATIIKQCLEVDEELQPDKIKKEFVVRGDEFEV